jgi:glycosyltransferase involved in cell wall biosynthesis
LHVIDLYIRYEGHLLLALEYRFLGRLKRHKLPDHAIVAFSMVNAQFPDAKLWVTGEGYMLERKFKVRDVNFHGRVSSELKYALLSRSHLALVPATREGWALVVTDANSVGTPVVFRD